MKTRFLKSATALMLICVLAFSLTGCDSLDYREAIGLYNAGSYREAAEIFAQLADYEDSARLETRCYYWLALQAMEEGNYESAKKQFEALGDYEDSALRITECTYQLALAAFENGEFDNAQQIFLENPDYRQTAEYLRRINWQNLYTALTEKGEQIDGGYSLFADDSASAVSITADLADPNSLILRIAHTKDMGYVFTDSLSLRITRDSLQADFTAESTFAMDFNGSQIGSQQTGAGTLEISSCTRETPLVLENFSIAVTDNLGESTSSTDPADCLMNEEMANNLAILLDTVPQILLDAGIQLTLADIGFASL